MKPPFSYYGGKQRMASKIVPLIPKHTVYVEPFAGGATILFAKPWPDVSNADHYREVINDTNRNVTNFFSVLRDNGKELCDKLALTLYDETEHKIAKDLNTECQIENARRFYVNVQQSFANKINSGWRRGVFGGNLAASWATSVERLPQYIDRMRSVHISCQDALKCIKQWDSPQTFFYCDPPYPNADQGHYKGYTIEDFQALVKTLDECHGSFLLSNYDQNCIPQDWERFEFSAVASSRGRGGYDRSKKMDESEQNRKRTEVVWRRFNRTPVRKEIQELYDSGKFNCFVSPKSNLWS
jgi:DNA adenine methylase